LSAGHREANARRDGEARGGADTRGAGVVVLDQSLHAEATTGAGAAGTGGAHNVAIHPVQGATRGRESGTRKRLTPDRRDLVTLGVVFASLVLLALNLRSAVTAVPPLLDDLENDLGLTPTVVGLMGALPALAFAAAGLLGVRIMRWTSAERIAVILLLVEAAGQLVRPWAGGAGAFLAVTAATLVAMGVGNVVLSALVKAWFPHRIGPITAAYSTAIAIGTSLPALIAVPVAHAQGWQRSLALWGLLALVAVPGWAVAARNPRARPAPPLLESRLLESSDHTPHKIKVWRSRITWGLALLFGCNALNLYAMFTWLPTRLTDAGASDARAGAMLSLFAGIGVIPSLVVPPLVQKLGRSGLITTVCVVFFALGYLGILLAPNTGTVAWVALAGVGGGGFPLVLTLFGLRSATPATAGALSGFAQGIGYLFAAAGPLLVGALRDLTGGWTAPFGFLLGTLTLMLAGGWLSASDHTVDDDLRAQTSDLRPQTSDLRPQTTGSARN
jgi:CP family cyanate transporter-like MFS transporter